MGEDDAPTVDVFNNQIRPLFLKILPGDVIGYTGPPGQDGHVGIVSKVDTEAMMQATSIYDLMRSVVVIESVYNGKLNYVFKRNMLQGATLDADDITRTWHLKEINPDGIFFFRDWYIGRLKK